MSSYQVLARKWRPHAFADMIGQEHVLRALINALDNERLHHAYLFTGMRGVGKTTIARIFAKCLNCETNGVSAEPCGECSACKDIDAGRFFDLIEVDAASRTKVDETRELLENVPYAPASGRYKVYLIDEVHMFSTHSFNALLKTLEEPPQHVKFLLATTDPQKVPVTVLSRCLQFNLKRMSVSRLSEYLSKILSTESITFDNAALELIAQAADGSVRDSLSLVEQAAAFGNGAVNASDVESMLGRVSTSRLIKLLESIGNANAAQLFSDVDALDEYAPDYLQLMGEMLSLLHRLAMMQSGADKPDVNDTHGEQLQALSSVLGAEDIQLYYQIGQHARRDMPFATDQREAFDMALLRMIAFTPQESAVLPNNNADTSSANAPAGAHPGAHQSATAEAKAVGKTAAETVAKTDGVKTGAQTTSAQTTSAATGLTNGSNKASSSSVDSQSAASGKTNSEKTTPEKTNQEKAKKKPARSELAAAALAAANAPDEPVVKKSEKKTPELARTAVREAAVTDDSVHANRAGREQNGVLHNTGDVGQPIASVVQTRETGAAETGRRDAENNAGASETGGHDAKNNAGATETGRRDAENNAGAIETGRRRAENNAVAIDTGMRKAEDNAVASETGGRKAVDSADAPENNKAALNNTEVQAAAIPELSIEQFNGQQWPTLIDQLGLAGMPRQLASHCVLHKRDEDNLHFQLEQQQEHLNTPQFRGRLQTALAERTRCSVTLHINVVDETLQTPARLEEQARQQALSDARTAIVEDPMVKQLLSEVDGVVDEASVQPVVDSD